MIFGFGKKGPNLKDVELKKEGTGHTETVVDPHLDQVLRGVEGEDCPGWRKPRTPIYDIKNRP